MKFYIAGRIANGVMDVRELNDTLECRGHTPMLRWYDDAFDVKKPYPQYVDHNEPFARLMIEAARDCELFILLWREGLEGALWEVGAALVSAMHNLAKPVCVVGSQRPSVFHALPQVKLFRDTTELLAFVDSFGTPRSE